MCFTLLLGHATLLCGTTCASHYYWGMLHYCVALRVLHTTTGACYITVWHYVCFTLLLGHATLLCGTTCASLCPLFPSSLRAHLHTTTGACYITVWHYVCFTLLLGHATLLCGTTCASHYYWGMLHYCVALHVLHTTTGACYITVWHYMCFTLPSLPFLPPSQT